MSEKPLMVVGAEAIVTRDNGDILLARRKDTGLWCIPGGQAEQGESLPECAIREVKEETGVDCEVFHLLGLFDSIYYGKPNHAITFTFLSKHVSGDPRIQPSENTEVKWFSPYDDLEEAMGDVPIKVAWFREWLRGNPGTPFIGDIYRKETPQ